MTPEEQFFGSVRYRHAPILLIPHEGKLLLGSGYNPFAFERSLAREAFFDWLVEKTATEVAQNRAVRNRPTYRLLEEAPLPVAESRFLGLTLKGI